MSSGIKKEKVHYFTPDQIASHNTPEDCWLSWLGCVYNLSDFVKQNAGNPLLTPIIANAGQDISHWFDEKTGNIKTQIHLLTGCETPNTPLGRYLHVPPPLPNSSWKVEEGCEPWWMDQRMCLGYVSQKTRKIRLVNTVTRDEHILQVFLLLL
jgi:cytochrome b involved in lipid metabolism